MRNLFTALLLLVSFLAFGQDPITVCSWNIKDFGRTKDDLEIEFIANTVKDFDVVAIQEVVAGIGGPQAVARLHDALNRKGFKWDYSLSEPTSGSAHSSERYAFLWKTSRLKKIGDAWLDKKYHVEIQREPYFITLNFDGKNFTLVSFHAIPKSSQPESEIKYFKFFPSRYRSRDLIFVGDFNLPESHTVFNPLKELGYPSALQGQKTSLKQKCVGGDCLASEFDNIFYKESVFKIYGAGIIPFYKGFDELTEARKISDHVPVYLEFSIN